MEKEKIGAIAHGAVTPDDWIALVNSLKAAIPIAASTGGWFVEVGVLSAKGTRGIVTVLSRAGSTGPLLSVDKTVSAESSWKMVRRGFPSFSMIFHLGDSFDVGLQWHYKIAWIFIDACHCEECVAADIAAWSTQVVPGGYMAFHDADTKQIEAGQCVHEKYHGDGVPRPYGVVTALEKAKDMEAFDLVDQVPAVRKDKPPFFGGLRVYKRRVLKHGARVQES